MAIGKRLAGESFQGDEFQPYSIALGQLALAWNDLHEHLGFVFCSMMGDFSAVDITAVRSLEIWHSCYQDRAAREMLRACADVEDDDFDKRFGDVRREILWLLRKVESVEEVRNNAIHSPLMSTIEEASLNAIKWPRRVHAFTWFGHRRARKLAKTLDLLMTFVWCRDTALTLRDYAAEIESHLTGAQSSLPERPVLPNRGQKKGAPPLQVPPK